MLLKKPRKMKKKIIKNCMMEEEEGKQLEERGNASGGKTVMVGVKLDQQSKELLTWALVKVAEPGDRVVALHVLHNSEVVDRDGKSSLLSLVKAFDSVLDVYEGFCNLKQVDLKLKICRGSSIRKILVRETKSYLASKVIVGTADKKLHGITSSTSVAKYCARKLSKDISVLAVNNGKIIFQRESSSHTSSGSSGNEDHHVHQNLFWAFHRTLSKKCKEVNKSTANYDQGISLKKKCTTCSQTSDLVPASPNDSTNTSDTSQLAGEESSSADALVDNSMALVPVQNLEACSTSTSLVVREITELRPGWPLLRREILSNKHKLQRSRFKEISVVQWAMQLPSRLSSSVVHSIDQNERSSISNTSSCNNGSDCDQKDRFPSVGLDAESGAIVLVGKDFVSLPSSPNHNLEKKLPKELESLHERFSSTCRLFSYQELQSATSNFMPEKFIGSGGSSQVYKGCLSDGHELAVKILKPSENAMREFVLEIEIITALHHKNIISLFGFCFEDGNLLLVYDFLSRGSLEENLHGTKENPSMSWPERFKVAVGVAEALDYLHGNEQAVIHRDVKSSNILLSGDFEPQLSDFGLAKWASDSTSQITCTDVAGTFGYLAPEYFMYGKISEKIDVYAFGVVLLELLSGRKPINSEYPKGQESLVMWAKPILNGGKVSQLLDPEMVDTYDHDQMERMVLSATLCMRDEPRSRPRMNLVLKLLNGDAEVIKWARQQISESNDINGVEKEEESFPVPNIRSHLNLALLDVEDDSLSISSIEDGISLEEYLQGRWSRSSSLD